MFVEMTLHGDQWALLAFALTAGVSAAWMWRESVKDGKIKAREDTLNTKVRELMAEVAVLKEANAELNRKYMQLLEEVRELRAGRASTDFHAAGDVNISGDAIGGGKR